MVMWIEEQQLPHSMTPVGQGIADVLCCGPVTGSLSQRSVGETYEVPPCPYLDEISRRRLVSMCLRLNHN